MKNDVLGADVVAHENTVTPADAPVTLSAGVVKPSWPLRGLNVHPGGSRNSALPFLATTQPAYGSDPALGLALVDAAADEALMLPVGASVARADGLFEPQAVADARTPKLTRAQPSTVRGEPARLRERVMGRD